MGFWLLDPVCGIATQALVHNCGQQYTYTHLMRDQISEQKLMHAYVALLWQLVS